jgi:beta-mannosidase
LSGGFTEGRDLEEFITGSQLSQAVGLRHPLERARTRWPECTGALYYKMNDNYPAASWSSVDWYGVPKLSHYFCQDAFTPLHACVIFDSVNNNKKALSLPVFLLDDNNELSGKKWEVVVRAYDGNLKLIKKNSYKSKGTIKSVRSLGDFNLTESQTDTCPLFTVAEVFLNGKLKDRTFYFTNYEASIGSLFKLPKTKVTLRTENGKAILSNQGKLPAVAANVLRPGHLDTFTADDNYIWLDPGESKTVSVNTTEGLTAGAWNAE